NQYIILNPGRTAGAIEFYQTLKNGGLNKDIHIGEAQTLVYACRIIEPGKVNIIGVKDRVLLSGYPASKTENIITKLKPLYQCFYPAQNVLRTSFENIGAIFHPSVLLFNAASIERGEQFYFYRDMTPGMANIIESLDAERVAVAKAYGIDLIPAKNWISYAYEGVTGNSLCERMQNNPAYYDILAPTTIHCRQITEDVPTGIIPMSELGDVAGIETPIMDSIIEMCSAMLKKNFRKEGRTLKNLGFENMTVEEILKSIH
ncbi:MAG: NAD/NADP octopine/nopaline dehydrogenase family protein, partial [Allobaculum sp.]|nr:NAD/NADP octopine/nopaline dehydrogenase family protein [Allobaculum sp.]